MRVFVAIDGDGIGQLVGRMSLAENVEGLRKVSVAIAAGNKKWADWALETGGETISDGGDEGRFVVESSRLGDLEEIRAAYRKITGHTCSVGVGVRLSEADKALLVAKLRGKDRVVFWDPEMESELKSAESKPQGFEAKKIADHYLKKADSHQWVYRVEDKTGQGPYRQTYGEQISETEGRVPVALKRLKQQGEFATSTALRTADWKGTFDPEQPGPVRDELPHRPDMIFGFPSPDHARQWFGDDGLDRLAAHGFHLRKIPAIEVIGGKSGRQVMFVPHPDYKPGSGKKVTVRGIPDAPGTLPFHEEDLARERIKLKRSEEPPYVYALESDAGEFWHPHMAKAETGRQLEAVGMDNRNKLIGNDQDARRMAGKERLADRFARASKSPHSPSSGGGDEEAPSDQESVSATQEKEEAGSEQMQVKEKIAEILSKVKEQAPMLEKMRQQAPDLYEAVKGAVEAMLLMARETQEEQANEVAKSELQKAKPVGKLNPEQQKFWKENKQHFDTGDELGGAANMHEETKISPNVVTKLDLNGGAKSESSYFRLAKEYFGLGEHVPVAVEVDHKGKTYSAQQTLAGGKHAHEDKKEAKAILDRHEKDGTLHKIALMNAILGTKDRHSGNFMFHDGKLKLIDNETALFGVDAIQQYPAYLYAGRDDDDRPIAMKDRSLAPLHPEAKNWLLSLDPAVLKRKIKELGHKRSYSPRDDQYNEHSVLADLQRKAQEPGVTIHDLMEHTGYFKSELAENDLSKACKCDAYKFPHRESGGKCKAKTAKKELAPSKVEPDPEEPVAEGKALTKEQMGAAKRLSMKYPTGTTKQGPAPGNGNRDTGTVKVKPSEYNGGEPPKSGETKWRSVRAGVIRAPDGTPTSSLNPSGK